MLPCMSPTRLSYRCNAKLTAASNALRRHSSEMEAAIQLVQSHPNEQLNDARADLRESFNQAQAAWDEYTAHLAEHGILSELPASTQV